MGFQFHGRGKRKGKAGDEKREGGMVWVCSGRLEIGFGLEMGGSTGGNYEGMIVGFDRSHAALG